MAVPSWKKRAERRLPDIDDCIEQLQLLADEKPKSIKTLGQLYVAALGFLYHLRLDQETIFSIRYENRARFRFGIGIFLLEYENCHHILFSMRRCFSQSVCSSIILFVSFAH